HLPLLLTAPPTSTLFPYTTLFRSRRERHHTAEAGNGHRRRRVGQGAVAELAEEIATPALERPVRHRHTRMIATRGDRGLEGPCADRKSTRLNSSHLVISYAVFCLK